MVFWARDGITLHHGDALQTLAQLPAESVHMVCTSPPYWNLRDYQHPGQLGAEATPELYVVALVNVFGELRRVLRPDGCVFLNLADSYLPNKQLAGVPWRVAFALQDVGWTLRSEIIWNKVNAMPDSVADRPTSSHESIFLLTKSARYFWDGWAVREPLAADSAARALRASRYDDPDARDSVPYAATRPRVRSGNLERVTPAGRDDPRDDVRRGAGVPWEDDGSGRNMRDVWTFPTQSYPLGHYATFAEELPDRCIRAGSSEKGVCVKCGAPIRRLVEPGASMWDARKAGGAPMRAGNVEGGRTNPEPAFRGATLAAWKAEHPDRTTGWQRTCNPDCDGYAYYPVPAVILDPFAGTGTTGAVARRLGRRAVLIELSESSCRLAVERCSRWHRRPKRVEPPPAAQLSLLTPEQDAPPGEGSPPRVTRMEEESP